jgi:hypothetical protein
MNIRLHFYASSFGTNQQTKLKLDSFPNFYSSMRSNRQFGWLLAPEKNQANKKKRHLSYEYKEPQARFFSSVSIFIRKNQFVLAGNWSIAKSKIWAELHGHDHGVSG